MSPVFYVGVGDIKLDSGESGEEGGDAGAVMGHGGGVGMLGKAAAKGGKANLSSQVAICHMAERIARTWSKSSAPCLLRLAAMTPIRAANMVLVSSLLLLSGLL